MQAAYYLHSLTGGLTGMNVTRSGSLESAKDDRERTEMEEYVRPRVRRRVFLLWVEEGVNG